MPPMGSTQKQTLFALALAGAVTLAAGCQGVVVGPIAPPPPQVAATLKDTEVRALAFPSGSTAGPAARAELARLSALVVLGDDPLAPTPDAAALAELRAYVERGGRVLLLGHAVRLVHDLGFEARAPRSEAFRWGYDARTAQGRARLGFSASSSKTDALTEGMTPSGPRPYDYFVLGGAPLDTALCAFVEAPPQDAELLGRLLVECDGERRDEECEPRESSAVVLARWRHGKGMVVGLGLLPDLDNRDEQVRDNGRTFVRRASTLLATQPDAPIGYWTMVPSARAQRERAARNGNATNARADRLLPVAQREVPGASLLANWGLVAAAHDAVQKGSSRTPDQVLQDDVLPAFAAGASVVALDLVEPTQGLPLPWSETDPLARPKAYVGSAFVRGYDAEGMSRFVREAHARSLLVHATVDTRPFGSEPRVQFASLRYVARQWADARRFSDGALDGVVLRRDFDDPRGLAVRGMQDFQPAMRVTALGERRSPPPGAAQALDAHDGKPLGARAFGVSDGWRNGFSAQQFPVGVLDASSVTQPLAPGEREPSTGGSHPDWIAEQAVAFVRERRNTGGAMLWQGLANGTASARSRAAAFGVSLEPLVAAVAARCSSTGQDGYRSAQQKLAPDVHADFAQTVPASAAVVQLRNNHFRLLGTGGRLQLDTAGLARFSQATATGVVTIADSFFRTRFFGGRPDASELRSLAVDLLAGEPRGEGGYVAAANIPDGGSWPRELAFAEAPRWPQRLQFTLPRETGRFSLRIVARAVRGNGVLTVSVDGEPITFLPFADGVMPIDADVALHLPTAAVRTLQIEAQDGGAIALDRLALTRTGDVAADADVLAQAGSLASLRERSSSTYHQESVEVATIADFPGFVVRAECERSVRGLQQERRFSLQRHKTLRFAVADSKEMREPFVLASDDPSVPDLAVVPLRLSRYERFSLENGELVLRQQPEANARTVFGFAFVDRDLARDALPHLARVLAAIDRPATLDLGERGLAELRSDLPIAWTRVVAVQQATKTPFLVKEGGWWTMRGAQQDGARDYLRIVHLPGDSVSVLAGHALLARTRPGPGSGSAIALKDPEPDRVTVRVLHQSPLCAPSVTMAAAFDAVEVDGKPWSLWNGRTVTLPAGLATARIAVRTRGGVAEPRMASTAARLSVCAYEPGRAELVFVAEPSPDRPSTMPFTAVLHGPRPKSVDGGEIVDEKELRHQDESARRAAEAGGTVIRFLPGLVRVRYGDHGS